MSLGILFKVQTPDAMPGTSAQLMFGGSRIPRGTFQVMRQADEVLREAQAAASQLRVQSAAALASRHEQAREEGFAQGQAQGMAAVLGTLEVERRLRELLSHRLAGVVEHCVRGVLGDLGDSRLLRERVLHLLRASGAGLSAVDSDEAARDALTLHVCPAQLSMAQEVVAELERGHEGRSPSMLTVVADKRRSPDALLLETRMGFVESDLDRKSVV